MISIRVLAFELAATSSLVGCGSSETAAAPDRYLTDAAARRSELVASLVNPDNAYSRLRLEHYETGDDLSWSNLPEWNPTTAPFFAGTDAVSGPTGPEGEAQSLAIDDAARAGSEDALIALGRAAFHRYAMQAVSAVEKLIHSQTDVDRYGLWSDTAFGSGGLIRVSLPDGTTEVAETCATCHSAIRDDALVDGAPNERLDLGRLLSDGATTTNAPDPSSTWGPGRVDVTTTDGSEPCRIADLRPVRWLTHLHQDATVKQRSVASLAIRIETLVITAHDQVLRPPREVSLGLALYVRTLANGLSPALPSNDEQRRGATLFESKCSGCHSGPGFTGLPVPIDAVGTDPVLGRSADRGTGTYRIPSLVGVTTRGPLLHDGTVPDLDAFFDPHRVEPDYARRLHGAGAIPGHVFGLDLDTASRTDLLAFLSTLR